MNNVSNKDKDNNFEKLIQGVGILAFGVGAIVAADPMKFDPSIALQQANPPAINMAQFSVEGSKCESTSEEQGRLTQAQLNSLLKFKSGDSKEEVLKAIGTPLCSLPNSFINKAAPLERTVYFLPGSNTKIAVVSFQKSVYRGFDLTSPKDLNS